MKFFNFVALVGAISAQDMFETPGSQCQDPLRNDYDVMDPWPTGCKVYMNTNPCNQYEMSIDG